MWCFGSQSGRRTLRVTNNRAYPIVVRYSAEAFEIGKQPDRDVSVVTLYRAYLSMVTGGGDQPQLPLLPGSTVELLVRTDLGESGAWDVFTEWDGLAMAAEGLDVAWKTLLTTRGGDSGIDDLVGAVTKSDCVRKWLVGNGGLSDADTAMESLDGVYGFLRECGADILEEAAKASGKANPLYGIASWLADTVVSAVRQVYGGIAAGWDEARAASGTAYRIQIAHADQACSAATIASDLGKSRVGLAGGCVGDWAEIAQSWMCDPGDPCADSEAIVRRVSGRWTMYTGFPSGICIDKAVADGVPPSLRGNNRFQPCASLKAYASAEDLVDDVVSAWVKGDRGALADLPVADDLLDGLPSAPAKAWMTDCYDAEIGRSLFCTVQLGEDGPEKFTTLATYRVRVEMGDVSGWGVMWMAPL